MPNWTLRATPSPLAERYQQAGLWRNLTLGTFLDQLITVEVNRRFRVWSETRPWAGTVGELQTLARRVAGGLRERGIGPDDVVAFQLPNCPEAVAVYWGVTMLGAVLVPIVHFYGPKEVGHILRQSGAKALITADAYGWLNYLTNLETLRPTLPELEIVITIPMGEPAPALGELADAPLLLEPVAVDPNAAALIAYTSGTTTEPKGVIHSHQSIVAEVVQLGDLQQKKFDDAALPMLNGAPLGHAIGMLGGILLPLYVDQEIHLVDKWNPAAILETMATEPVYAGAGAAFFLQSLLDHPDFGAVHAGKMQYIGLGGSSVPLALAQRATDLGISIMRSYGSTEHPSTTGARYDTPVSKRIATDGYALPGVEIRIVDETGRDLPTGEPGEIWSRGPDLCAGYTDPALTAEAFDEDGWYHSGDIGALDADGWLSITDRKKDIIIRGGETISPIEIEDLLLRMPAVAEVAVVAAPDPRLGEHGCAFLRLKPGVMVPTLDDIRVHLAAAGLAKQKWPEELRIVKDLPRTASGKVKKNELRQSLRGV